MDAKKPRGISVNGEGIKMNNVVYKFDNEDGNSFQLQIKGSFNSEDLDGIIHISDSGRVDNDVIDLEKLDFNCQVVLDRLTKEQLMSAHIPIAYLPKIPRKRASLNINSSKNNVQESRCATNQSNFQVKKRRRTN